MTDSSLSSLRNGLRLIGTMVRMHPASFSIAVLGAALFAGAGVAGTVVVGRVTDRVVLPAFDGESPSSAALALSALAIIVVAVLRVTGVVMRRYFAGKFGEQVSRTIRKRLRDHYVQLPFSARRNLQVGDLIARADNDADVMVWLLHPLPLSIGVIFLAVFSAISLLVVDLPIAIVAFLVFPVMAFLNRLYTSHVEEPAAAVQRSVGEASAIAHESFDGALVVKTLGRAEAEAQRFDVAADRLQGHRVRVGLLRAAFEAGLGALPTLGIVLVVGFGVFRVDAGAVTPGELIQIATLFTVLGMPMRVFGFFLQNVPTSLVAFERINQALALPTEPVPVDVVGLRSGPLTLAARGVTFAHPDSENTIEGLDLSIDRGEVVALVGSTGSGKSTLLELLAGLLPPDDGVIELDETPIGRVSVADRTTAIAMVFQESFLFADTVRANIDLVGDAPNDDLAAAIDISQVSEFIDVLPRGLQTVVGERGVTLSGGQRQRVALARALVRRPQVILLDDATSAIDPQIEQRILDGLRHSLRATTVVVAQRLSTIALADRVLWLDDGRIVAAGSHEDLMGHDGYRSLVSAYEVAR